MAKTANFLPDQDLLKLQWLGNFTTKLPNYAATFGLTPDDVVALQQAYGVLLAVMTYLESLRKALAEWTAYKEKIIGPNAPDPTVPVLPEKYVPVPKDAPALSLPNVLNSAVAWGKAIQGSPKCTDQIARDLGLVPVLQQTNLAETPAKAARPKTAVKSKPALRHTYEGTTLTLRIVRGKPFRGRLALIQECADESGLYHDLTKTNATEFAMEIKFEPNQNVRTLCFRVQMFNGDVPEGEPSDVLVLALRRPGYMQDVAPMPLPT